MEIVGKFPERNLLLYGTAGKLSGKVPKVHGKQADKLSNGREIPQVTGGAVNLTSRRTVFFLPVAVIKQSALFAHFTL
ncbi:MAG: hypothetical protein LBP80_03655 [Treponema sp.]|jgi:hypothetical protein|nr:hypothetical protein [Treponema sp.]